MTTSSTPTTVITGATAGVGLHLAIGLAAAGHRLVLGARDLERGARSAGETRRAVPGADVQVRLLDLASLESVAAFADGLGDDPVDRLVLNAATMTFTRRVTEDGFEAMLGTNALGHFALTLRLLDRLRAGDRPRVVTQSSESHRRGKLDLADLQHEHGFSAIQAYHDSKQAQHVLAVELARRISDVESVVAQPGWVVTELGRDMHRAGAVQRGAFRVGNRLIGQTPAEGARAALVATLDAAVPDAATGNYVTPSRLRRLRGAPRVQRADPGVLDAELGRALWERAVDLTALRRHEAGVV